MPGLISTRVACRYRIAKERPTDTALAQHLKATLAPGFPSNALLVYVSKPLAGETSVIVEFFQALRGASSKVIRIWVHADGWAPGTPVPDQVIAETVNFVGVRKLRKTQGSIDKVVRTLISWFRDNQKELTSESSNS